MPASPAHKSRKQNSATADELSDEKSPRENSHESQASDVSPTGDQAASSKSVSAKKRHHSKSNGPRLNTWDVPEFLPGALPGASAVQREYFQERSIKVFRNEQRMQQHEERESMKRQSQKMAEKLADDIAKLKELFPFIEPDVIQETYLVAESNMNETVNQLLVLTEGASNGNTPMSEKRGPPSSEDEKEFPVLTDKDGWEVVHPEIELRIEDAEDSKNRYVDRLLSDKTPKKEDS